MLKTGMIIAERYEILSKIGTGGMADVYKAKDHKLNRFVAVKVLKPEFREDTTFIRKFRSEAQAAAGLTHPNIVNVFDVGDDEGAPGAGAHRSAAAPAAGAGAAGAGAPHVRHRADHGHRGHHPAAGRKRRHHHLGRGCYRHFPAGDTAAAH